MRVSGVAWEHEVQVGIDRPHELEELRREAHGIGDLGLRLAGHPWAWVVQLLEEAVEVWFGPDVREQRVVPLRMRTLMCLHLRCRRKPRIEQRSEQIGRAHV